MKRILCAVLMTAVLATPAFAAKLYLKDGGVIQAKRVWRSGDRVYVLATRDTLTSFEKSEVNLKRTFPKRHRMAKRVSAIEPQTATAAPKGAAVSQKPEEKKGSVSLPALPKLPEKSPDSLAPSSGGGGSISQHKKEMSERIAE
jgi:Tfp pilus assembly protein PilZ